MAVSRVGWLSLTAAVGLMLVTVLTWESKGIRAETGAGSLLQTAAGSSSLGMKKVHSLEKRVAGELSAASSLLKDLQAAKAKQGAAGKAASAPVSSGAVTTSFPLLPAAWEPGRYGEYTEVMGGSVRHVKVWNDVRTPGQGRRSARYYDPDGKEEAHSIAKQATGVHFTAYPRFEPLFGRDSSKTSCFQEPYTMDPALRQDLLASFVHSTSSNVAGRKVDVWKGSMMERGKKVQAVAYVDAAKAATGACKLVRLVLNGVRRDFTRFVANPTIDPSAFVMPRSCAGVQGNGGGGSSLHSTGSVSTRDVAKPLLPERFYAEYTEVGSRRDTHCKLWNEAGGGTDGRMLLRFFSPSGDLEAESLSLQHTGLHYLKYPEMDNEEATQGAPSSSCFVEWYGDEPVLPRDFLRSFKYAGVVDRHGTRCRKWVGKSPLPSSKGAQMVIYSNSAVQQYLLPVSIEIGGAETLEFTRFEVDPPAPPELFAPPDRHACVNFDKHSGDNHPSPHGLQGHAPALVRPKAKKTTKSYDRRIASLRSRINDIKGQMAKSSHPKR